MREKLPPHVGGTGGELVFPDPPLPVGGCLRIIRCRGTDRHGSDQGIHMPTLNWIGKQAVVNHHREVPYHLLRCDNLLALKALLPYYAGQVKCIYIDPPYNTGSAFTHYDDGMEHSIWLSMMQPRLVLLHELLSANGSIWINIDDAEGHYLKVMCDEIFGRHNFLGTVTWQKTTSIRDCSDITEFS